MGLDMYLHGTKYIGSWDEKEKPRRSRAIAQLGLTPSQAKRVRESFEGVEIKFGVGYWRKSNAIHKWFVDNVQKGVDDCGHYHVGRDQLQHLRAICLAVIDKRAEAKDALPTQQGFFFGVYEYDEYYFENLKETVKIIDFALKLPDGFGFEYHSSW